MFNFKFLILNICIATSLIANDGFDDEDEFGGDEIIAIVNTVQDEANDFNYYGSVTASSEYNYADTNSISSNKLSTNLKLEHIINKNIKFKSNINAHKASETGIEDDSDLDINELTIEGTFSNGIDAKIGRQIVVWGKSDNIRITDTINPMDMTSLGMVDIKDLRLGRTMSKFDYFYGKWAFSGMILHENRFSKLPKKGSDYYRGVVVEEPSNGYKNTGVAFSINGNLERQDVAFYYSNQFVDNTEYKTNMVGFAYNKVKGSFLYKTEVAHLDNYDSDTVEAQTDALVGIEYNGIDEGSISLEIANKNENIQYAVRFTQSYVNQTVDLNVLFSGYGENIEDGGFVRVWTDYSYNDELTLSYGAIDYIGGDNQYFEKIKNNDRIFASLKYSF